MAQLDQGLKFRPNATPGYLEASIILKSSQLPQHLSSLSEDEKAEEFKIARKMGTELLERSKDKLKMIVETRKALVKQQQVTMLNKKEKEVALKSKIVSEISRFGGEWKSPGMVEMELSKLERENQKRDALEWQIRYHSKVLKTKDYVPKDKRKGLFRLSLETKELKKNLKEILKYAPHLQDLAAVQTDEARITAHTLLTDSEHKRLFDERVSILKERLNKQRENRKEKKKPSDEVETAKESNQNQPTVKKKKKGKQRKDLPSPGSLIGKRVEHIFMIAEEGKKRRRRTIFTGTIFKIVKEAADPLYTLFEIEYDIDGVSNDDDDDDADDDEEELQTVYHYTLLVDYMTGDLIFID